jgi:aminoglycoside phosphotransferase (APT) family kinase protein
MEAEVLKLSWNNEEYVLKIWNKRSKPDVEYQYDVLRRLKSIGVAASTAYGWGIDHNNDKVLLTSYDGSPLTQENDIHTVSKLLADLHRVPVDLFHSDMLRRYDFVTYFFPQINNHPDIKQALLELVEMASMESSALIHGDYNLGNILADQSTYTIIDWTNVQLGDRRYDFAWASFLIRIYNGEDLYRDFTNTYLTEISISSEDILRFEPIACLRWLLINRIASLPNNDDANHRVNDFISSHNLLPSELCLQV